MGLCMSASISIISVHGLILVDIPQMRKCVKRMVFITILFINAESEI